MTFEESIPLAKQLAENQLKKGFDVEAFLILSAISNFDVVPESTVDDNLKRSLEIFTTYYNTKSFDSFKKLLSTMRSILSEVYHNSNNEIEREEFKRFVSSLSTII